MPRSLISAESSGGVRSGATRIALTTATTHSFNSSQISPSSTVIVLEPQSFQPPQFRLLFCWVVIQILPKPSLDLCHAHPLAFVIVADLIAVDFAETEISRFRVGKIEPTHARAGPHRKRLSDQHPGVRLHIEQTPKGAFFRVIRACGITRSRPDAPILLLDEIRVTQALRTTVTPFIPHSLVQAFGESFSQAIGDGLRHDGVVIV